MADDDKITVQLTADFAGLQAGMAEAQAVVTRAADGMTAAVHSMAAQQMADFGKLQKVLDKQISSVEGLAQAESAAESALDRLQQTVLVTTQEAAAALTALDSVEAQLAKTAAAATIGLNAQTVATAKLGGVSAGVTRELAVMTGEALRGNYTRLIGSTTVLANRTGLLAAAIGALTSPIGLSVAALAVLGIAVGESEAHVEKFNQAAIETGGATGLMTGSLMEMAREIGAATQSSGKASDAVLLLAKSAQFSGEQLRTAATAAVQYAQMTGDSIGKASDIVIGLAKEPLQAANKLNETMRFLTASDLDTVKSMVQVGDSAGAAALIIQKMAEVSRDRVGKMHDDAGNFSKGWENAHERVSSSLLQLGIVLDSLGSKDASVALEVAKITVANDEQMASWNGLFNPIKSIEAELAKLQLPALRQQMKDLTAEVEKQEAPMRALAAAAKLAAEYEERLKVATEGAKAGLKDLSIGDSAASKADADDFAKDEAIHVKSLAEQKAYWTARTKVANEGPEQYRQAIDKIAQINREMASKDASSNRKEESEAKRHAAEMARGGLDNLQEKRDAAKIAGQDLEAIDQQILDYALKTYHENSTQYRAAKKAQEADSKAAAEKLKGDQQAIADATRNATHEQALDDIAYNHQKNEDLYRDGKISASRLLAVQQQLDRDKLAADLAYLNAKKAADAGDVAAQITDAAVISHAWTTFNRAMEKDAQANAHAIGQQWKRTADSIAQAMGGALDQMIFHGQTFKQTMINFAEQIAQAFIQQEEVKLSKWILTNILGQASDTATATATIATSAAEAGAAGVASMAGAPWPLDMTAPAFGASMYASALSFGFSAEGGWDRVPFNGAPAILHKDEMVLPAPLADRVRDMTGGGSGMQIHIHATDADSVKRLFMNHGGELATALRNHVKRNPGAVR